jgi:L-seryl-tRNA(Ser) seleniumtransferase
VDKLTYAALEATLLAYVRQDYAAIPTLRMIYTTAVQVRERAESLVAQLGTLPGTTVEIIAGESVIGGGTTPNATLPSFLISIVSDRYSSEELQTRLRTQTQPVIARILGDQLLLDLRTVFPQEEAELINQIGRAVA